MSSDQPNAARPSPARRWVIVAAVVVALVAGGFLVLGAVVFLTAIRYFGLDARSAYRWAGAFLIRALGGGHLRPTAPHWQRRW